MVDPKAFGFEWQVIPQEDFAHGEASLFLQARSPQLPFEMCSMPTAPRPARRVLRGQDKQLAAAAEMACAAASSVQLCVDDVVLTGDVGLATLW